MISACKRWPSCLFLDLAANALTWGIVEVEGTLYPLCGVLWRPNPPIYYTFPRQGASFGDDAYDMLVGTRGWFGAMGWSTLITGFWRLGQADGSIARTRAGSLRAELRQTVSVHVAEWLVD